MDNSLERARFQQFRCRVIQPTLGYLGYPFAGESAINLLLGTTAQESQLIWPAQYPTGPAVGPYMIEGGTHDDLFTNDLNYQKPENVAIRDKLAGITAPHPDRRMQLCTNLYYATAIARLIYYRAPDPLPRADDIDGLAKYWKRFYNTPNGKGSVGEFVSNYKRFIGG